MSQTYTPKDVRSILDLSASAIRNYVDRYSAHISESAKQTPRQFSEEDLRLFAYVREQTSVHQLKHTEIEAQVSAGALENFDWQPPMPAEQQEQAESTGQLAAELRAATRLVEEYEVREQELLERLQARENELQTRIDALERELADLKTEKRQAPAWWRSLFGGSTGE